jgi:hypothetical protein
VGGATWHLSRQYGKSRPCGAAGLEGGHVMMDLRKAVVLFGAEVVSKIGLAIVMLP